MPPLTGPQLVRWVLGQQRGTMLVGALAGISWMGSLAGLPVAIGVAIDRINGENLISILPWAVTVMAVVLAQAVSGVVRHRSARLLSVHSRWLVERLCTDRVLDPRGGVRQAPGALLSLATSDADNIGAMANLVCRGSGALVTFGAVGALMLDRAPLLAAVLLVGLPMCMLGLIPLWKPLQRRASDQQAALAAAASAAADAVVGLRVVRGVGGEPTVRGWFAEGTTAVRHSAVDLARLGAGWNALSGLVPTLFLALVIWIAGDLALSHRLSPGELVTFAVLALFLTEPLGTFAEVGGVWASGLASAQRLAVLLTADPDVPDAGTGERPTGATIAVEQVHSGPVRGLDLLVGDGEMIGVAAADPAMAQTVVRLLARRDDPTSGVMRVGGVDARRLSLDVMRSYVVVVDGAQPWLLAGSLAENLTVGDPDIRPDAAVAALLAAAGDELAQDLQLVVGERGVTLSGGQRQRVAMARGLVLDPPVLVLADTTSALDAVTEQRAVTRLRARRVGRTTVAITTSPTVLDICDRVVFLSHDGALISATHRELIDTVAGYRDLVNPRLDEPVMMARRTVEVAAERAQDC